MLHLFFAYRRRAKKTSRMNTWVSQCDRDSIISLILIKSGSFTFIWRVKLIFIVVNEAVQAFDRWTFEGEKIYVSTLSFAIDEMQTQSVLLDRIAAETGWRTLNDCTQDAQSKDSFIARIYRCSTFCIFWSSSLVFELTSFFCDACRENANFLTMVNNHHWSLIRVAVVNYTLTW